MGPVHYLTLQDCQRWCDSFTFSSLVVAMQDSWGSVYMWFDCGHVCKIFIAKTRTHFLWSRRGGRTISM